MGRNRTAAKGAPLPAITGVPGDLSSTGKARWRLAKRALADRWADEYAPTLDFYIRALEAADAAWDDLTLHKATGTRHPPVLTVEDSRGDVKSAPAWRVWREAKASANVAAAELGLTPKARAALGDATVKPSGGKFGGRF